MLNPLGVIPFGKLPARRCGEVGTEGKQFPELLLRRFELAQLAEGRRPRGIGVEVVGHVDANRQLERFRVIALVIRIHERGPAEQGRIVGIELHGSFHDPTTPLRLAGMLDEQAEDAHDRPIHGIQCQGLFRRRPEGNRLLAEKVDEGQRVVTEGMSCGEMHGALCRGQAAVERLGSEVEVV